MLDREMQAIVDIHGQNSVRAVERAIGYAIAGGNDVEAMRLFDLFVAMDRLFTAQPARPPI